MSKVYACTNSKAFTFHYIVDMDFQYSLWFHNSSQSNVQIISYFKFKKKNITVFTTGTLASAFTDLNLSECQSLCRQITLINLQVSNCLLPGEEQVYALVSLIHLFWSAALLVSHSPLGLVLLPSLFPSSTGFLVLHHLPPEQCLLLWH